MIARPKIGDGALYTETVHRGYALVRHFAIYPIRGIFRRIAERMPKYSIKRQKSFTPGVVALSRVDCGLSARLE